MPLALSRFLRVVHPLFAVTPLGHEDSQKYPKQEESISHHSGGMVLDQIDGCTEENKPMHAKIVGNPGQSYAFSSEALTHIRMLVSVGGVPHLQRQLVWMLLFFLDASQASQINMDGCNISESSQGTLG